MGKKKMVMRRIAALLIASLVVTSSAFTSLAVEAESDEKTGYYELTSDNTSLTLKVGGNAETLKVKAGGKTATKSDGQEKGKATSSDALNAAKITWTPKSEGIVKLTPSEDGWSCEVAPLKDGTVKVSATANGNNLEGDKNSFTSVVEFTVKVDKADTVKPTIELNENELTLESGASKQLTANVTPTGTKVVWDSVNKDVATVSEDGTVTAASGLTADATTEITATVTVGDETATAICKVTVKAAGTGTDEPEPELSISLDRSDLTLEVNEKVQLTAIVLKDNVEQKDVEIAWSIRPEDSGIIICNKGEVTALKEGNATVIASTTVDKKPLSVECNVTVVDKKPQFDKTEMLIFEGATGTITAQFPTGAEVVWGMRGDGNSVAENLISIKPSADNKTCEVTAKTGIKGEKGRWAVVYAEVKGNFGVQVLKCWVKVLPNETVVNVKNDIPEDIQEAIAADPEVEKLVDDGVAKIKSAVGTIAKATVETNDAAKETFKKIEGVPDDSELKLLSVTASTTVVKDADGNLEVVVTRLVYDISVVCNGEVIPHEKMLGNEEVIRIDVDLPDEGIKDTWNSAMIKHFAYEGAEKAIEEYATPIRKRANGKKFIRIKATSFSPFEISAFSEDVVKDEDDKPATSSNTGSPSGGGGGSRRHVVGGGSSTNSYSMSGSWVMGANGWTFVKTDGQLAANTWGWINGQYYYFDANGNMMTGWQFINGKWYYLNPAEGSLQGAMLSGVLYDPAYNAYFYADASGAMVTGWYQVGANWYYFSPVNDGVHVTGQLLAGTYVDGYYLGADGAWVPGN